jgi:hypothetical protein
MFCRPQVSSSVAVAVVGARRCCLGNGLSPAGEFEHAGGCLGVDKAPSPGTTLSYQDVEM